MDAGGPITTSTAQRAVKNKNGSCPNFQAGSPQDAGVAVARTHD